MVAGDDHELRFCQRINRSVQAQVEGGSGRQRLSKRDDLQRVPLLGGQDRQLRPEQVPQPPFRRKHLFMQQPYPVPEHQAFGPNGFGQQCQDQHGISTADTGKIRARAGQDRSVQHLDTELMDMAFRQRGQFVPGEQPFPHQVGQSGGNIGHPPGQEKNTYPAGCNQLHQEVTGCLVERVCVVHDQQGGGRRLVAALRKQPAHQ